MTYQIACQGLHILHRDTTGSETLGTVGGIVIGQSTVGKELA